jgi:hypothetical protein
MKKSVSVLALAALGLASTASAQLAITQLGTTTTITFDADTPGIYIMPAPLGHLCVRSMSQT